MTPSRATDGLYGTHRRRRRSLQRKIWPATFESNRSIPIGKHWITGETKFGIGFVIISGVKASKGRSLAAQRTYETQIRPAILGHQAEAGFLDETEALLRLRLDLRKRVAHEQIIGDQRMPTVSGERKIPSSIRNIERTPDQFPSFRGVLRPRRQRAK